MSLFTRVRSKLEGYYSQGDSSQDDPHKWRLPPLTSYTIPKPPRHNTGDSSTSSSSSSSSGSDGGKHPPTIIPNPRAVKNAFIPIDPTIVVIEEDTNRKLVYPDPDHAAVHLALLQCFRNLRLSATALDVDVPDPSLGELPPAYSVEPRREEIKARDRGPVGEPSHDGSDCPLPSTSNPDSDVRDNEQGEDGIIPESTRWNLLLQLAVTRFTAWWLNIDKVLTHAGFYTLGNNTGSANVNIQLTKDYLPPLDVLLVWYAFMLHGPNSGAANVFREHHEHSTGDQDGAAYLWACQSYGLTAPPDGQDPENNQNPSLRAAMNRKLENIAFPWPAIKEAIDFETMDYSMSGAATIFFTTSSGQQADIMQYLSGPPAYAETPEFVFYEPEGGKQVNLFQAVRNQEKFFDQADELLWIRSPALEGSLERACNSYLAWQIARHMEISVEEKGAGAKLGIVTNTLPFGVELIWRTHRLFPAHHKHFCERLVKDAKTWGREMANEAPIGLPPNAANICACWICERIRDDAPGFAYETRPSDPASPQSPTSTSCPVSPTSPDSMAVDSSNSSDQGKKKLDVLGSEKAMKAIRDDVGFYKAVEEVRKQYKGSGPMLLPTRPLTAREKDQMKKKEKKRVRSSTGSGSRGTFAALRGSAASSGFSAGFMGDGGGA